MIAHDRCVLCGVERSLFAGLCARGPHGEHDWQERRGAELALDCVTCRRRLVVAGVPFVEHETELGRVRRALLAQQERVGAWIKKHGACEIVTSAYVSPLMVVEAKEKSA